MEFIIKTLDKFKTKFEILFHIYVLLMAEKSTTIMSHLTSPSCNRILDCLNQGLEHPDEIARELDVVRQTVDWHLLKLSGLGIVDRVAESSLSGRPRIIYKLNPDGKELINAIDKLVSDHLQRMKRKYDSLQHDLDIKLARAEISEMVYVKRVRRLEKERQFLESD